MNKIKAYITVADFVMFKKSLIGNGYKLKDAMTEFESVLVDNAVNGGTDLLRVSFKPSSTEVYDIFKNYKPYHIILNA